MNNLLTYCGLVDARKSASEKDLPVLDLNSLEVTQQYGKTGRFRSFGLLKKPKLSLSLKMSAFSAFKLNQFDVR